MFYRELEVLPTKEGFGKIMKFREDLRTLFGRVWAKCRKWLLYVPPKGKSLVTFVPEPLGTTDGFSPSSRENERWLD